MEAGAFTFASDACALPALVSIERDGTIRGIEWVNPDAPVDERRWRIELRGDELIVTLWNDARTKSETVIVRRTGVTPEVEAR